MKANRKAKPAPRKKPAPRTRQIVVRTPAIPEHRYDLSGDQVALITRTIAKGATPDELQLFLWVAKRHRLDPFTRQLHLVKRKDSATGEMVATIQVGIDGYRQMASRYPDFGSTSEAEYGPDKKDEKQDVPEWAKVRVFKKGISEPSVGVAYWDEYSPDLTNKQAFMWRKMPKHMLAKCAEAIALRKAYPDLADIYTDDEMARTNSEYTESGRRIVEPDAQVSGKALEAAVDRYDENNPALQAFEAREKEQLAALRGQTIDVDPVEPTPEPMESLFYRYYPESETYRVGGTRNLIQAHKELLGKFWDGGAGTFVVRPEQLGKLISQFERLKVPFKEVK
jgi:phage recombination protein Bet